MYEESSAASRLETAAVSLLIEDRGMLLQGLCAAMQGYRLSRNSGHFCSVERSKICMRSGFRRGVSLLSAM